jgi:hypothetical protein
LAAVTDAAPKPTTRRRSKSVAQAAADGDARGTLIGMRARVATAIDDPNTPARDLAALTRRLMEITKDIEAMDARDQDEAKGSAVVADESFDASAL